MIILCEWWVKNPTMNIIVKEYQVYKVPVNGDIVLKRRLLCKTNFHFFQDLNEDKLQKCEVRITDDLNSLILQKVYSQIDNRNRKFFTNQ